MRAALRHPLRLALAGALGWSAAVSADAVGDAARGGQQVGECASCHGAAGEGVAASAFPRLAGQPAAYLVKQLQDFAGGSRHHAVMAYFAKRLNAQAMADIGAWYATLDTPPAAAQAAATDAVLARGRVLVAQGDSANGIPACASCHGPDGKGGAPGLPYIGGQHAEYLTGQLEAWRDGGRHNDAGGQMAALVPRLSAADVAALAAWLSRQPPPHH